MTRTDEEAIPLTKAERSSDEIPSPASSRGFSEWRQELTSSSTPTSLHTSAQLLSRITIKLLRVIHRSSTRLIPGFIRQSDSSSTSHSTPERISRTEWLNGVRGFAALFVFFHHFQYPYHDPGRSSTGYLGGAPGTEHENRWVVQMPFIRLLHAGNTMVALFYIVSGFSLSIKPVRLMREQSWEKLLFCLASSTWRRVGRLYIPCLAVTLGTALGTQIGLYDFAREKMQNKALIPGWTDPQPDKLPTLGLQLADWFKHMALWARPFVEERAYVQYDNHLWTIPVEYRCSLILFVTTLGLSRMRLSVRVISQLVLMLYCSFGNNKWEMVLFYSGFFLAELDAIKVDRLNKAKARAEDLPSSSGRSIFSSPARLAWFAVAIFAMYLMSAPDQYYETAPGYVTFYSWVPTYIRDRERFVPMFGSILFMLALSNVSVLRKVFASSLGRYLGRVSFMLYVVQHSMNQIFGYRIVLGLRDLMNGHDDFVRKEVSFFVALVIHTTVSLLVADLLTRTLDDRCLQFMRWAENKCIAATGSERDRDDDLAKKEGMALRLPM